MKASLTTIRTTTFSIMTRSITTLCHAECHSLFIVILSVIMMSVVVPGARAELDHPKSTRTSAKSAFDTLGINVFEVN